MAQKTVLITGCSKGGIGDALAKEFHAKGLRVFATARNLAKVQHLKDAGLEILQLDVTDDVSIKQAVASVKALTGGTLDILVNNSGGGYSSPLIDSDIAVVRRMFDVNVFALVSITQAFSPFIIASKGTIINIGSIAGVFPIPWQGYYNASKAAVNLLTDQMRLELSPWGVKAILVITGGIKTHFFDAVGEHGVTISEGSPYYPARSEIEPLMAGSLVEVDGMDVDVYAKAVVSNALSRWPKKHQWVGSSTFIVWFFAAFGWATIWDLALPFFTRLPAAIRQIRAAEKKQK